MGERKRRHRNRPSLALLLPSGLVGVAVAWLAIHASLSSSLDPATPRTVFAQATSHSQLESLSAEQRAAVTRAAAAAPLAGDPFMLLASGSDNADEPRRADMLEEARDRNPRMRLARLQLLDHYVRAGQINEAGQEMLTLIRLMPEVGGLLVDQLATMAVDPRTRDGIRQVIGDDPMLDHVLERLVRRGADPDAVLRFAGTRRVAPDNPAPVWRGLLVQSLVERGEVDRAFDLWRTFAGMPDGDRRESVYDGQFRRLAGSPPFNWQLTTSETGAAEFGRDRGLEISYFGRRSGRLASQLLTLEPGRYRMSFQAEGNASGTGSRLIWRIICRAPSDTLLELPIREINYSPRTVAQDFTVPASCGAQWLHLDGEAAEFPTSQNVTINVVAIERRDGTS